VSHLPTDLRLLVLPASRANLVLPIGAVAEVVLTEELRLPMHSVPDWVLGVLPWRGYEVPVAGLADCSDSGGRPQALVVCFAPSGVPALPYLAIASPRLPQLERVVPSDLAPEDNKGEDAPWFVRISLRVKGSPAWLPHLAGVEKALLAEPV